MFCTQIPNDVANGFPRMRPSDWAISLAFLRFLKCASHWVFTFWKYTEATLQVAKGRIIVVECAKKSVFRIYVDIFSIDKILLHFAIGGELAVQCVFIGKTHECSKNDAAYQASLLHTYNLRRQIPSVVNWGKYYCASCKINRNRVPPTHRDTRGNPPHHGIRNPKSPRSSQP